MEASDQEDLAAPEARSVTSVSFSRKRLSCSRSCFALLPSLLAAAMLRMSRLAIHIAACQAPFPQLATRFKLRMRHRLLTVFTGHG